MTIRMATLAICLVGLAVGSSPSRPAEACSPAPQPAPGAFPRAGAEGVSTMTSVMIHSASMPRHVELTADGLPLDVAGVEEIGSLLLAEGSPTRLWRVHVELAPSAEHVVTIDAVEPGQGDRLELTRFGTAAGYGKNQGTAAALRGFELWRIKYPEAEIASGNCVFAEYHTTIHLDYDPAAIPDTPPRDTLYAAFLRAKTGGGNELFWFTGDSLFAGSVPEGEDPFPSSWPNPDVDPTREYCLRLRAQGYGDLARLPVWSKEVCAAVQRIYTPGTVPDEPAPADAAVDGPPAGETPADAGPAPSADAEPAGNAAEADPGGCAVVAGDGSPRLIVLLALALIALSRRQRASGQPRA